MRPSELTPNEFELAILHRLARQLPGLTAVIPKLHVVSRQFTGVGCYTSFRCDEMVGGASAPLGIDNPIQVPGVKSGLDAILFFESEKVKLLEVVAIGGEAWDGVFDGFSIPTVT